MTIESMNRMNRIDRMAGLAVAALTLSTLAGCAGSGAKKLDLPTPEAAKLAFSKNHGVRKVAVKGNVVIFHIRQPGGDLRRGGSMWAEVGPYIYLFSPGTRNLFQRYKDLGGVQVTTVTYGGQEVATALLPRDTMSELLWQRSLNILGHALKDGSSNPAALDTLINWGEAHTRFNYNKRFLPN